MQPKILTYAPQREYFFREGCFINELCNSDSDPALSIARVRLRPGDQTRWHHLEGTVERYVIIQGVGEVEIDDLVQGSVSAGDVVLIPAGCRQRIRNSGSEELIFLALCTPRFVEASYRDQPE
jgi:mannose-6-phosphate isomerase-like protein (cupin superfamily)